MFGYPKMLLYTEGVEELFPIAARIRFRNNGFKFALYRLM